MSYDITFILKSEEPTWAEAPGANEARAMARQPWNKPVSAATRAGWQPIITALLHAYPDLHRYAAPQTVELSDLATGVKVALYDIGKGHRHSLRFARRGRSARLAHGRADGPDH
jgi:hypothetical protein